MFALEKKEITDQIIKCMINNIITKKDEYSIIEILYDTRNKSHSKFMWYESVLANPFLLPKICDEFIRVYTILQKTYYTLSRFVYFIKYKRARTYNTTDLFGDAFSSNKITIFENNTKYVFSLKELIHIINTSLSNSVYFFNEPISCKNPYTNIPFMKSSLYNIYFAMRKSTFILPVLLHQFFLSNFDLTVFSEKNEWLIHDHYLESYSKNITSINIRSIVLKMLDHCQIYGYRIHVDFPKDRLLEIMRPYIDLYYKARYSINHNKSKEYIGKLRMKLYDFFQYNPTFGRKKVVFKYITVKGTMSRRKVVEKIVFNESHIHFFKKEVTKEFMQSHLKNNPDDIIYEEDEEEEVLDLDSDSDSQDESDEDIVYQS